jgi:ribosomal protein S18 acetylase RimI-like enzyme
LQAAEEEALRRCCCKLTLEVLSNNQVAQTAYRKAGFAGYQLDPKAGQALFWQKKLRDEEGA